MQLNKVFDPRDRLDKARRKELEMFAHENGVSEITEGMPALVMRRILRQRNITNITIPNRSLGSSDKPNGPSLEAATSEINADDLLMAEWEEEKPVDEMNIQELRKKCKEMGMKQAPTDNTESLRARLNGQDTA